MVLRFRKPRRKLEYENFKNKINPNKINKHGINITANMTSLEFCHPCVLWTWCISSRRGHLGVLMGCLLAERIGYQALVMHSKQGRSHWTSR
jgi:hypothetical protein